MHTLLIDDRSPAELAGHMSDLLEVLANPMRLLMIGIMLDHEISVRKLSMIIGLSPASTSQHLARLRELSLVTIRRDAQLKFYRVADERCDLIRRLLHIADQVAEKALGQSA